MINLTDNEIIDSVKKGNTADFALLVDRYKNKAFPMLKRMLKNEQEAEEVLQDCFLKSFQSINGFRAESKFSTWFYKIVYNTALTKLSGQKRKTENEMASLEDEINLADILNNEVENEDLSALITRILEALPAKYSSILDMFYLCGMSCEEISGVAGITVQNVKVILHRARNSFREYVEEKNLMKEIL
jgi:RNA polymerase sigma factor (sigma-70 family)